MSTEYIFTLKYLMAKVIWFLKTLTTNILLNLSKEYTKRYTHTKQWKFVTIICAENSIAVALHQPTIISYVEEKIVLIYSLRIVNGPLRQLRQFLTDHVDKAKKLNIVYYTLRCLRYSKKWHKLSLRLSDENLNIIRKNMPERLKLKLWRNIYSYSATMRSGEFKEYSISTIFSHNWIFTKILRRPDRVIPWHFLIFWSINLLVKMILNIMLIYNQRNLSWLQKLQWNA